MNKQKSTYDKFLDLRAATIESVALAWSDDELKAAYIRDPIAFMKEYLKYQFPFKMKLEVKEGTTPDTASTWKPQETGGWVGPNNTLEMILPPKPEGDDQQSIALSVYNANHLTIFGGNPEEY